MATKTSTARRVASWSVSLGVAAFTMAAGCSTPTTSDETDEAVEQTRSLLTFIDPVSGSPGTLNPHTPVATTVGSGLTVNGTATFTLVSLPTYRMGLCLMKKVGSGAGLGPYPCTCDRFTQSPADYTACMNAQCGGPAAGGYAMPVDGPNMENACLQADNDAQKYCYRRPGGRAQFCAGTPVTGVPIGPGTYPTPNVTATPGESWITLACTQGCTVGTDPSDVSNALVAGVTNKYTFVIVKAARYSPGSLNAPRLYFTTNTQPSYSESKAVNAKFATPLDGQTYDLVFDFSANANWKGTITGLRFDPFDCTTQGSLCNDSCFNVSQIDVRNAAGGIYPGASWPFDGGPGDPLPNPYQGWTWSNLARTWGQNGEWGACVGPSPVGNYGDPLVAKSGLNIVTGL
jgi:hypothetical protein